MKKIMGILMLMVFIVSMVPLALAEETNENLENTLEETASNIVDTAIGAATAIKESVDEPEERADRMRQAKAAKDKTVKTIKQAKENFEESRRRYNVARGKFQQAHEVFKENKGKLDTLRERAKCVGDNTECREHKGKLKSGVKDHLIKKLDVIMSSLERLESKIEDVEKISNEDKTEALATIAELKTDLELLQEKTAVMADDASGEDLRASIKEINEAWRVIKKGQKTILAGLMNSRMDNLVEKHNEYINGMELRIDDLREKGEDVAQLERIKDAFAQHVENLVSDHNEAKQVWQEVKAGEAELTEWKEAQKLVRKDMSDSKKLLREFMSEYKNLKNPDVSTENTSTEEE